MLEVQTNAIFFDSDIAADPDVFELRRLLGVERGEDRSGHKREGKQENRE